MESAKEKSGMPQLWILSALSLCMHAHLPTLGT
jgi:hypothetical protein